MRQFVATVVHSIFVAVILLGSSSLVLAANTIHVPANQPTIQAGINAAVNGDTVVVSPGTYYENINFNGKAITVTSTSGPAVTIIDGNQTGVVVTFATGETLSSVLSGFTIQNASTAGIDVSSASPTIKGNIIAGNLACGGSGIAIYFGSPFIKGNIIARNGSPSCSYYGYAGIVSSVDTGVQISGNVISANSGPGITLYPQSGSEIVRQNTITHNTGGGFFMYGQNGSKAYLIQNLIIGNQGVGVSWVNPPVTLIGNTIAGNTPSCCPPSSEISASNVDSTVLLQNNLAIATGSVPAFSCGYLSGSPTFANNDVFAANSSAYNGVCPDETGISGNISTDPLFADMLSDNFHLQSTSPAVNAGLNSPNQPNKDFDGDLRVVGGAIDMGVDEYTAKPTLASSAYALHFAAQNVGTSSAAKIVTLTNSGTIPMQLTLIATGSNYSQTNNCGTSLAAGASCQISVRFAPIAGGTIESVLGIFSGATLNPLAVTLAGTGLAPTLQIDCCFNFYNQVIGTTTTQSLNLSNVGLAPLLISTIAFSGPADFVETNNCPIAPNSLPVGSSCKLTVSYTPTTVGSENGSITVTSNAGSQQATNVYGTSVSAGTPVLSPASLTFPTTLIGKSSASQDFTLTNTGTGALGIGPVYSYYDFQVVNHCPVSLAVNASCSMTVTFTPSTQGTENGWVQVYTDSATSVQEPLYGTGSAPLPTISSLSLTNVPAGSTDTQVTITGTGFVSGSQVLWNGIGPIGYAYISGSTQITFTVPAAELAHAGTAQISVFTPMPGGGDSNALPFTVFAPINYAVKSTTYGYRNITGTNLYMYYFSTAAITSPFPIQFGGGSYTNLNVGAGGTVTFSGYLDENNDPIPTTRVPTLVTPFWGLLYPFGGGNDNNVFWQVLGTSPNRQLVIEWRNVGICCETTNTIKFQVVFFEGNSNILFNYADTVFGGSYSANDNGALATVGVQVSPNLANQFSYKQSSLASATALLWYPSSPTATTSTSSLGFGYHQIGTSTLPQSFTLTNGGLVPLTISGITIDNPDFKQTNNCGTSVASHQSCKIQVVFKPTQPSTETATLTITDNASNAPQTVTLTGLGTVTSVVVYPALVNFGSVPVGATATAPVTLANASNQPMTIQQISTSPSVYTQTNNCGVSLAPGLSCVVSVAFTPTQKISVQGTLSMGLNGQAVKVFSQLTGSGS